MEVNIVDKMNIGDSILGIRIYTVDAYFLQNHISIAIFPVRISLTYIYPFKRVGISLTLFTKFVVTLGMGVDGNDRQ